MEEERFAPPPPSGANPNPRPVTSGIIIDRFRALAPGGDEVAQMYEDLLSELTFNSKPIITELTIIAGEQMEHGEGIAEAICARIVEVTVDQKLPSLYLLDSIVKNIGREYVRYFAGRLPKVFCEAYNQVNSNMHPAMCDLLGTWSQVFPSSVLHKIEGELQFSTTGSQRTLSQTSMRNSESPSHHPSHGIHVNSKYLEARQQLQHSPADIEHASGNSSKLHGYNSNSSVQYGDNSNSSVQYGDHDFNNSEVLTPHFGRSTAGSSQTAAAHSSISAVGQINHLNVKVSKRWSPPRSGVTRSPSPIDDRFSRDGSSWRTAERASQPQPRFGPAPSRAFDQHSWLERSCPPEVGTPQLEHSTTYDPSIGYGKKHPRELIDAYGSDRGKSTCIVKLPKLQRIHVNDINRESATKNWRSFEEEEYVWDNMSSTLADRKRSSRSSLPMVGPSFESLSRRIGLSRADDYILDGNNWHGPPKVHPVDNPTRILDDMRSIISHESMHMTSFNGNGGQHEYFPHYHSSHHVQEPGKFPYNIQHGSGDVNSISRGLGPQILVPGGIVVNGQKVPSPVLWPPIHKSLPPSLLPVPFNHEKQFRSPFRLNDCSKLVKQGPKPSIFPPHQQFKSTDGKLSISSMLLPFPHQQGGLMHDNQQNQEPGDGMRSQSQDARGGYVPSLPPLRSSRLLDQPLNSTRMQGPEFAVGSFPNQLHAMPIAGELHSTPPHYSALAHGGIMPPLPHVPPLALSHMWPSYQSTGSVMSGSHASAFSGLLSTLMAQGVISLAPPARPADSVGFQFNAELLKARHESAINALYANLPRQCTTCGLRLKCQEEHSNHMDWHLTKNRISKKRKQKPSRKWFVNTKEWLNGAETVGTNITPFLPTEIVAEKKEDDELAVPADEHQIVCALCEEPFDDFYSDEVDEWMYKGAVYLNVPYGNINGLDRSQLGPIVHVKCISEAEGL